MKVLLLASLLCSSLGSWGQVGPLATAAPPRTATTLLIRAAGPPDSVWICTGQQLFARGCTVKYSDKCLGLIVTDNKVITGTDALLFLAV